MVLKLYPNYWNIHWILGQVYTHMGRYEEGIATLQKAMDLLGEQGSPEVLRHLGYAYGVSGRSKEARQVLQQLEAKSEEGYVPTYFFATVYAGLGEKDLSLEYLEKAYQEHDFRFVFKEQAFDSLMEESRYIELSKKIGYIN